MSNKIAIIYEGIKTEKELFKSLKTSVFKDKQDIIIYTFPADGNIYMLWERLKDDDFETDIISVLKEMCKASNDETMDLVKASDFSEVYLFFDYDIHSNNLKAGHTHYDAITEMLETFDNETDLGKLYISYPMIEAIKDISLKDKRYQNLYIDISDSGDYKNIVGQNHDFSNYSQLTLEMWKVACLASRRQASLIVNYNENCEYKQFIESITQDNIYIRQRGLYEKENRKVIVLNSIPLFLLEYFKEDFWDEIGT